MMGRPEKIVSAVPELPRAVLLGGALVAIIAIVLHVGLHVEFAIADNRPKTTDQAVHARQFAFELSINRTGGAPASQGLALIASRSRGRNRDTLRSRATIARLDADRNQMLGQIREEFLSRASACGLSLDDVINAWGEQWEGNGR